MEVRKQAYAPLNRWRKAWKRCKSGRNCANCGRLGNCLALTKTGRGGKFACYAEFVPQTAAPLANWKPVPIPNPLSLRGRYAALEPLDAARHGGDLWEAVKDHNALWTWLAASPPSSASALMESVERWRQAEHAVLLAILPTETGRAAGWASYMRITPAQGVIEVGNILFSPELQRTRAATEAMYLMARHVFEELGYRRYEWKCNAENGPSRRAALRFGFTFEGIFRQHMVVKGQNRDTAWFSMLDHEWPARKRAFDAWLQPENFDSQGRQLRTLTEFAQTTS
jgi:RimJ/RimL family protein N-acetyltransferase